MNFKQNNSPIGGNFNSRDYRDGNNGGGNVGGGRGMDRNNDRNDRSNDRNMDRNNDRMVSIGSKIYLEA